VLHTWSQTLLDHYRLHRIATGGGLLRDGKRRVFANRRYFLPALVLSQVFSGKFRHGLRALFEAGRLQIHGKLESLAAPLAFYRKIRTVSAISSVVFCKPPFAGPEQVLGYPGALHPSRSHRPTSGFAPLKNTTARLRSTTKTMPMAAAASASR